ncbi:MAG: ABC transporter permease [Acidobacteria bacterium]|nr:MAG: ABC transporter permease [Acidobacteriota bacterium]
MRDLRYALRLIAKSPWLSLVAVLSLALGLGANTTIFAFANRLLLQKPPVANPSRLVEIYTHDPDPRAALNGDYPLSYPDYLSFLHRAHSLSGLLAYSPLNQVNVVTAPGASTQPWTGELVTDGYFHVLGLHPALGRWFVSAEDTVNDASPVVVLSFAIWKTQFGGLPGILGRTVQMNGAPYSVIGVAPESFHGLFGGVECNFWAPVTMSDHLGEPGVIEQRAHRALLAVGRLNPGVTLAAASTELDMIQHQLDQQYPKAELATFGGLAVPLEAIPKPFRGSASSIVLLLEVVVGLVLLIACTNTALVLLAQALGRQREWALRAALGASRRRLLRQGLVHSVLLALIAGGLGLGIAELLWPLLIRLRPSGFPLAPPTGLSASLIAFTFALALVAGILFGLAPALQATRLRVLDYIKDGTPGSGGVRSRLRSGFIIAQMALCVVVLVGAALCLRSLARARAINPGFDTQHLVLVHDVSPQSLGHNGPAAHQFLLQVRQAVDRVPGVTAAAWIVEVPLQTGESDAMVLPPGASPGTHGEGYRVEVTSVSPNYFRASGTPLLAGRGFTEADLAAGRHLIVINENLARHFWPQGGAVGHEFTFPGDSTHPPATIVGVAANGKYHNLNESPRPYLYELTPIATPGSLMIHVAGSPASFLPAIRKQLQLLDPNLLSANIQTGAAFMELPLYTARMTSVLLGSFGILALLLAIVGLYGVMATTVTRRTREYGIRMALGAGSGNLLRLVLGQGLRLALWGTLAGVVLAALLTRYLSSLLYGMSPADPVSYFAAVALLIAVTLLASLIPALRAARVDPLPALRQE